MKKALIFLILAILTLPIISCGEDVCNHYYLGETIKEQTCTESGIKRYTCTLCNDYYDEIILPDWHVTDIASNCIKCGAQVDSTISCEISVDGTFYTVKEWLFGEEHKQTLTLPKEWKIGSKGAILPIKEIGEGVFKVTTFSTINLPPTITVIRKSAFENLMNLKTLKLTQKLEQINEKAFYGCWMLTTVYLPKTLNYIGKNAFNNCPVINKVYYEGSEEEFSKIQIASGNESLTSATIIFNSEN